MNIFQADKVMTRLDEMLDAAMEGQPIEKSFDETRVSALETKLRRYLNLTGTSRQQLEEEKLRVNQLVSDISHQTKTPIANILLYAQLLEEASLGEQERVCVQSLVAQAEKLNFLIASLVKTSRLESGIITVAPTAQPVQPLLEGVQEQIAAKAQAKGITIACTTTQAYGVYDLKWTAEALYNLVDNAVKYTPSGGTVTVGITSYQLFCRIDVSDTGMGIEEQELAQIFTRFYRSAEVAQQEGVGIGLYLAREIVTSQGGYIKVQSTKGKGSTFSMFLPAAS